MQVAPLDAPYPDFHFYQHQERPKNSVQNQTKVHHDTKLSKFLKLSKKKHLHLHCTAPEYILR